MSIVNPAQLVAEFKKSGEFDRMRREMLAEFQKSDAMIPLMSRVEDIARQKLQSDKKLEYMPQGAVHRELMEELDRYPVIDRAVGDFRSRSDGSFSRAVNSSLKGILHNARGQNEPGNCLEPTKDKLLNGSGETMVSQADPADQSNDSKQQSPPPGAQNDNMDIEDSSDESVIDVSNKASVEQTADETAQTT